ncbi:MAG: lamin tail domain-containing protein, partial [Bacteroidetes bacterium]|nr:lamin tail domain-containing protein [Bacteroidota bacterium]
METLRNKGIRFFGPNATVAQDMEPEYVTVANDSLAYVTCQENNAIAVIDYKNGVILDVFSCRYADHSWTGGSAYVEEYFLNNQTNWPVLGTPEYGTNTPTVMLGGFSGLFYDSTKSVGGKHIFYAIPDRGPNGDAISKANVTPTPSQNLRPFKLPNYQARIVKIVYDEATDMATVDSAEQIFLYAPDGTTPISGKGNVPGVDEVPVTYYDANSPWSTVDYVDNNGVEYTALPFDPLGGDFEGILRDKHGNFWMCDEYRPAIYKFDSTGRMIERFIPPVPGQDVKKGLIISEYGEGTSNNKFMEFYNATDKTINFDDYLLVNNSNDPTAGKLFEFDNSGLWAGKTLAPGQVFVIAHPSAQADILAKADTTHQFLSNGDDWYAILNASDSSIVDQIGDASADPGSGWDVAGVSAGTQDHTLVRKGNVTVGNSDWAKSAGMDSLSSEWIVLAEPTADTVMPSLGFHKSLAFADLFISEYAEGTSNNKYLEFYNPTNKTIHFNDYMLVSNGNDPTPGQLFEFDNSGVWAGKTLAPGDVFIIAHPQAQADILAKADTTFTFLSNGDDWYAILNAKDSSIVDQVGDASADPGAGWDVAGVTEGTKDHTLVRKMDVYHGNGNWAASAGTDAMNSEWIVLGEPTADTVMASYGMHMPAAKFNTVNYGSEKLPMVYNKRRANRGFEAIAYDFDHDIIYLFIQSPIENPSSSVRNNSDVIRILGVDLKGNPVAEYVY